MFTGIEMWTVLGTFLGIGAIVTIVMALINWCLVTEKTFELEPENRKSLKIRKFGFKPRVALQITWIIIVHLGSMFSVATIGGIIDALWLKEFFVNDVAIAKDMNLGLWLLLAVGLLFFTVFPILLTYLVGFFAIKLANYDRVYSHIIFLLTFIISIACWTNYIVKYEANIETTTEVFEQSEERELIMFYEIPVQQVSGSISGSSFVGFGEVSGDVFTTEKVPYVYLNAEGNGEWDFVPAADSEIVFITEAGTVPKIVIVTYTEKTIDIDHNVEQKSVTDEKSWTKYYFYLPKSVIQSIETE